MVANKTGDKRLRAGLPKDWRDRRQNRHRRHATTNDIAVIWPPGRGPLVVTVYFAELPAPTDARNAVIAEVGRLVAQCEAMRGPCIVDAAESAAVDP